MATLKKSRVAQYALHTEFTFNVTDSMLDVTGALNASSRRRAARHSTSTVCRPTRS
jgi:hypothetical protein